MTIGLPKALLYYRYHVLWETFFTRLGCEIVTSGDTGAEILSDGSKAAIDENCLPVKLFVGHVKALIGRCDYILVPRLVDFGRGEEMCVSFLGLYDIIRNTFADALLLCYNVSAKGRMTEASQFMEMGITLGFYPLFVYEAYSSAKLAQKRHDIEQQLRQEKLIDGQGTSILIAAQSYVIHDPYIGAPVTHILREQGAVPIYSDYCNRGLCRKSYAAITKSLYWTASKEITGSVELYRQKVDGIILAAAFPCATDAFVNELILRRVKDVPVIQLLIDEQQGEAGLRTRLESFIDVIQARRNLA